MQDEIRVTVIATGFEESPVAAEQQAAAAKSTAKHAEPVFEKVQSAAPAGMYTAAAEKAVEKKEDAPAAAPGEEDPFDSIFKIFNAK